MQDKGAIIKVKYRIPGKFPSNVLLVKQKDAVNLKLLNKLIPYKQFKWFALLVISSREK